MPCFAQYSSKEIILYWINKYEETVFKFQKVQLIRDTLKFELIANNMHKEAYQCIFVATTEKSVHMDDEFGNEYKGATVIFQGDSNKLALNQVKKFTISIPAPKKDVRLVNLHFGLYSRGILSNWNCDKPLVDEKYNFHQLNWDVSKLR
jgi:hypothetical protein